MSQSYAGRGGLSFRARWTAGGAALLMLCPLLLAAWLTPSPTGVGTHRQLGLPACQWYAYSGVPCPTCGMTTAFALAADGRLIDAFVTQPAGMIGALLAACIVLLCGWAALTGSRILAPFQTLWRPAVLLVGGVVLLAAWGYKFAIIG